MLTATVIHWIHSSIRSILLRLLREIVKRKSRYRRLAGWFGGNSSGQEDADFWVRAFSMCQGLVDASFKAPSPKLLASSSHNNNNSISQLTPETFKLNPRKTKAYVQRSKPLYENCHLMAPDGELLSTCNSNKAMWYVDKELGDIVSQPGEQLKVGYTARI